MAIIASKAHSKMTVSSNITKGKIDCAWFSERLNMMPSRPIILFFFQSI